MNTEAARAVRRTTIASSIIAVILSPIPLADEIVLVPVYANLTRRIARTHNLKKRNVPWRPIAKTTVAGLAARAAVNIGVSYIPGVAAVCNAISAALLTRVLGTYIDEVCAAPEAARAMSIKDFALRIRTKPSPAG